MPRRECCHLTKSVVPITAVDLEGVRRERQGIEQSLLDAFSAFHCAEEALFGEPGLAAELCGRVHLGAYVRVRKVEQYGA